MQNRTHVLTFCFGGTKEATHFDTNNSGRNQVTTTETDEPTLLDRFAMATLPGLLATTAHPSASNSETSGPGDDIASIAADAREIGWGCPLNRDALPGDRYSWADIIADEAYMIARAMLKERTQLDKDGEL